jgi:hypothetical protein
MSRPLTKPILQREQPCWVVLCAGRGATGEFDALERTRETAASLGKGAVHIRLIKKMPV